MLPDGIYIENTHSPKKKLHFEIAFNLIKHITKKESSVLNKLTILIQRRIVVIAGCDVGTTRSSPEVGPTVVLIIKNNMNGGDNIILMALLEDSRIYSSCLKTRELYTM